jgi:hypothetical protein
MRKSVLRTKAALATSVALGCTPAPALTFCESPQFSEPSARGCRNGRSRCCHDTSHL